MARKLFFMYMYIHEKCMKKYNNTDKTVNTGSGNGWDEK